MYYMNVQANSIIVILAFARARTIVIIKEIYNTKEQIKRLSIKSGISIREFNKLNRKRWFHGTTPDSANNIIECGVIADYNIGSSLDFGCGFYLTDTFDKAVNYISRVPMLREDGSLAKRTIWSIVEFEFNPLEYILYGIERYTYMNFPKHDERFAEFVFHNRLYNVYNNKPHGYDIIWGVMSDNRPDGIILSYKDNTISYETAIQQLCKSNSMRQLYIGNQQLCDELRIVSVTEGGCDDAGINNRE